MSFEWDEAKSRETLERRGFGFEFAARIFEGKALEREDRRRAYGEQRIFSVGEIEDQVFVVVYTVAWKPAANYLGAPRQPERA